MKQPTTEDLTQLHQRLREEISEARGTLKDLRHEIKAARELVASTKDLVATLAQDTVMDALHAEVTKQVEQLGTVTEQTMRKSVEKVTAEFDKLRDILLGNQRATGDQEKRSIPELLQDPAVLAGVQRRLGEAGRE